MSRYAHISSRDVASAQQRVNDCHAEWARYSFRRVDDREAAEALGHMTQGRAELRRYFSLKWRFLQLRYFVYRSIERTRMASWGRLLAALIAGVMSVVLYFAVVNWFVPARPTQFLLGMVSFFLGAAGMAALLLRVPHGDVGAEVAGLQPRLQMRRANIKLLQSRLDDWTRHWSNLKLVQRVQQEYEYAVQKHAAFVQRLNDRRYQLIHSQWRALRDTEFEVFIAEIFQELGYSVQLTKATGDQGVDVIVTGKGRRIAIQTKGYHSSVGNKAVQEVYAGMAYYQLTECIVITNSRFTSGAVQLAQSVNCTLIDENAIPQLIEGRIY